MRLDADEELHMKIALCICFLVAVIGCGGPTFRNIGIGRNNIGVSPASIDAYPTRHGLTHEQAVQRMRTEAEQNRIAEHAEKYGISQVEAKAQLEFASTSDE